MVGVGRGTCMAVRATMMPNTASSSQRTARDHCRICTPLEPVRSERGVRPGSDPGLTPESPDAGGHHPNHRLPGDRRAHGARDRERVDGQIHHLQREVGRRRARAPAPAGTGRPPEGRSRRETAESVRVRRPKSPTHTPAPHTSRNAHPKTAGAGRSTKPAAATIPGGAASRGREAPRRRRSRPLRG